MRMVSCALALVLLLAFVVPSARTQCPPYGCCNGMCPSPYPRYPGYGCSSSSYYQAPPPHVLGGPAYGFTFPYPWGACCPYPGGKSYIAPAYPSYYYYPFSGQSYSFYNGSTHPSVSANSNGTVFATERTSPWPPQATVAKSSEGIAPTKTSSTSAKHPMMLPESISSKKKEAAPARTAETDQKSSFMRRLFFWQN